VANKRYEVKTVASYMGATKIGPLQVSIGFAMKEGWTNPNKNKLLKQAGFQTSKEILNDTKIN
jgi:hypothetical protein